MGTRLRTGALMPLLVLCVLQASSTEGLVSEMMGNITFECPDGYQIKGPDCYLLVNSPMKRQSAAKLCEAHGASLVKIRDEVEGKDVGHMVQTRHSNWTNYWVGNVVQDSDSACIWFWAKQEPQDRMANSSLYVAASPPMGRWEGKSMNTRLPFVCRTDASVHGTFRCRDGKKILSNMWKCDGIYDCEDQSDESNCAITSCTYYMYEATGTLTVDSALYKAGKTCTWYIEGPPEKLLAITFQSLDLEADVDYVEVWSGSPSLLTSKLQARLTGSLTNRKVYGCNNFLIVKLVADLTVEKAGFTASWAPGNELSYQVQNITASDDWVELTSPSYSSSSNILPVAYDRQYTVSTDPDSVITMEVLENGMGDGFEYDPNTLSNINGPNVSPDTYVSLYNTFTFYLSSDCDETGRSRKFKARVKKGCALNITSTNGNILPPSNKERSNYLALLTCTYAIYSPVQQGFKVEFPTFQLPDAKDAVKVYNGADSSAAELTPTGGYTGVSPPSAGTALTATAPVIYITFRSSRVQTNGDFSVSYNLACPPIANTENMTLSSSDSSFGSEVTLNCVKGFAFEQEEYVDHPSMNVTCGLGGKWNVSRLPTCAGIYCGVPPSIPNGFIMSGSGDSKYGATVAYQCFEGFNISGSNVSTCGDGSKWSTLPVCQTLDCGPPPSLPGGTLNTTNGNGTDFGSVVQYSCNAGYGLIGYSFTVCRKDGTWSKQAPACQRLRCPVPEVDSRVAKLGTSDPVDFEGTLTVSCSTGYVINGTKLSSKTYTCPHSTDFGISYDVCVDLVECENQSSCTGAHERCKNTIGSFTCVCEDNYRRNGNVCEVINRCTEKGTEKASGCDDKNGFCQAMNGGLDYECNCSLGYTLFTQNGTSGRYIPSAEDGTRPGDLYYLNHTCVPKTCSQPPNISDGEALTTQSSFDYGETVEYRCNFGYELVRNQPSDNMLTCQENDTWDKPAPQCRRQSCEALTATGLVSNIYPNSTTYPGNKVELECRSESTDTSYNKTLFCAYDRENNTFRLQGDKPHCPAINCGDPQMTGGANFTAPSSKGLESSFVFDCTPGFRKEGTSTGGNDTVTCEKNGRWGLGNLTCVGTRCKDPGTPGGMNQTSAKFEAGGKVVYSCHRPGFEPDPEVRTCVFNSTSNMTDWNGMVPVCKDVTKPVFNNCPAQPVKLKLYSNPKTGIDTLNATDNSGLVKMTVSPKYFNSDVALDHGNHTVTYTATDAVGNYETCVFTVVVNDPANMPELRCKENVTVMVNSTASYSVDLMTEVSTDSDSKLSFSPGSMVTVGPTTVGKTAYRVTATNTFGFQRQCAFIVDVRPNVCLPIYIRSDIASKNALVNCGSESGDMNCTVTCKSGFAFQDGSTSMDYGCTGSNNWTPSLPPRSCVAIKNSDHEYAVDVTYQGSSLVIENCVDALEKKLTEHIPQQTVTGCTVNQGDTLTFDFVKSEIISATVTSIVVRVFLSVSNSIRVSTATCASRLGNSIQTSALFDVSGTSFKCGEENITFTRTAQNVNSSGPTCSTGRVLVSIGSKNRCVSCEPGFYFKDKACSKCEHGQYQNLAGETQCKRCGDAQYSNEPRVAFSQCVASCPVGFYNGEAQSANPAGCISCAENTFLATLYTATCRSCLDGTTTSAFQGATQCTDKCAAGRYPVNNTVCAPCPRGYYKITVGNTACTPCDLNQTTLTEGADESTDCVAVNQTLTCQNNGSGQIDYHVNVCGCPAGYSGETCQQPVNACDSSPCYNGGTCAPSSPDSYQCTCRIKEDCKMDRNDIKYESKDPLESRKNVVNVTDCQKLCIDNKECAVILYYDNLEYCLLYTATEYVNGTTANGKGYIKSCLQTELFGGSQCEIDKEKNCKDDTCAEESFCRELIGGADCVCPSESKYRAPRCDLDLNVCDNKACFNGAKCIDSGNGVRATCVCLPGFTGEKCEKNMAECEENPAGCLYNGTCKDGNGTYTCDCPLNFSGDHCQNKPNFCKIQNTCANGVCYNDYNISSAGCVCEFPYKLGSDGNCVAQDLCSESNPCQNGSTCDNGAAGKTSCRCLTGYSGSLCQHNIDDCASNPCVNGECTDLVNNYTCTCHPGYEGANCENNTNDCSTANCDGNNTVICDDLLMDFKCKCKVGFTGKRCESNINECLSLPCQHNGTCTDSSTPGNYSCSCQDGWLGKDCEELPGFCSSLSCKNSGDCLSVQDDFVCNCGDGTFGKTCETTTKLCDILNPCTNASFCMNTKGTAVCQCPKDYSGGSCHLREDGCSNSPCQNRGTCVLQEMGRTCECAEGFSGDNCNVEASPCGSTTCPSDATCIVENLKPLCLCGVNKLKTGSTCKNASTDYDICFKTRGEAIRSYQPFKLTNRSLSVIIWVAPVEDTNDTFFQIKLRSNGSSVLTLAKDSVVFGSESPVSIKSAIAKVDLNEWNQLTVTWTSSGSYQVFLDGVNLPGGMTDGTFPPLGEYLYTHIGYKMKGCISQASVWQSVMSFTDSLANYGTPRSLKDPGNLVHGWGGNQVIMDNQQTTVVTPSMAARSRAACAGGRFGSDCSGLEPDKDPPMMTACPEKETFLDNVTRLVQITDRYKSDGTTTNLDCTLLTFGAHSVVFMASDVVNNVAFCRFRAYVRRPGQSCGNTKGLNSSLLAPCGTVGQKVQCPNKGLAPLSPRIVTCGQLGSYNLDQPYQLPPAIVCGDMGEKTNKITSTLKYELLILCDSKSEDAVEIALKQKVVALQNTWLQLCPNNTCTNVDISAKCESSKQKNVTATITMDAVPRTLNNSMTNVTLTAQEFIEHATLELLSFNITAVSGAKFQAESATIKVVPSCASGYGLHGDKCVRCTQGSFLDNSTGMCKLCPIGRYTSTDLQTQCMKCAEGKTTLQLGATSCKKKCNPGEFLNMTSDQCDPCPKNFYQDEPGQIYCLPCPACKATESTGANNASLCFDTCAAGTELKNSTCVPCNRGYFRDGVTESQETCKKCPTGKTTEKKGSTSYTQCSQRVCYAGSFLNKTDNQCYHCPIGQYQPAKLETSCLPCDPKSTTNQTGRTTKADCIFFCDAGHEVLSAESKKCKACERGYFKENDGNKKFDRCQKCSQVMYTTDSKASVNESLCNVPKCEAGQAIVNGACSVCPKDTFQPEAMPTTSDKCQNCTKGTGTLQTKQTASTYCKPYCGAGEQYDAGQSKCEACPLGTWNTGNSSQRFEQCAPCPQGLVTNETTGAITSDLCTLRNCSAGQFINSSEDCSPCPVGYYQNVPRQTSCKRCRTNTNTSEEGQDEETDCTIYCVAGKTQAQGKCELCDPDFVKPNPGYGKCEQCSGNVTSNSARTDCNITFCDKGYVLDGSGNCSPCDVGKYKNTRGNSPTCVSCSTNTTTADKAATSKSQCDRANCAAGFYSPAGSLPCLACAVGHYKNSTGNANCTACSQGYTTAGMASTAHTQCSVVVCPPGQIRDSTNKCEKCAAGFYQNQSGETSCDKCDNGYTTVAEGSDKKDDCKIVCPSGQFRVDSSNTCKKCVKGTYQVDAGKTSCQSCPANYTTANEESKLATDCFIVCAKGFRSTSRTTCELCFHGQYQNTTGSSNCEGCASGKTTLQTGSVSVDDCMPICGQGQYLDTGRKLCEDCALGSYNPQAGNKTTVITSCDNCTDGFTTASTKSTSASQCNIEDCRPGFYRSDAVGCQECPLGKFQPMKSQPKCQDCANGKTTLFTKQTDSSSCVASCLPGEEYNVGIQNCQACLLNFYRPAGSQPVCKKCPQGKTTLGTSQSSCVNASIDPKPVGKNVIMLVLRFEVEECDNRRQIAKVLDNFIFQVFIRTDQSYPGLWSGQYQIVFLAGCLSGFSRKKRSTPSEQMVEITLNVTDEHLKKSGTETYYESLTVARNAFYDQQLDKKALIQNKISFKNVVNSTSSPQCGTGQYVDGQDCRVCAAGTYSSDGLGCFPCSLNMYQNNTGQIQCLPCPDKSYTSATGATHQTNCTRKCDELDARAKHCSGHGACMFDATARDGVRCDCDDNYSGSLCMARQTANDDKTKMIAGIVGGAGAFLLLLLVIVGVVACLRRAAIEGKKRNGSALGPNGSREASYMGYPENGASERHYDYNSPLYDNSGRPYPGRPALMYSYMNPVAEQEVRDFYAPDKASNAPSRTRSRSYEGEWRDFEATM